MTAKELTSLIEDGIDNDNCFVLSSDAALNNIIVKNLSKYTDEERNTYVEGILNLSCGNYSAALMHLTYYFKTFTPDGYYFGYRKDSFDLGYFTEEEIDE